MSEKILELKAKAELHVKEIKAVAKEIEELGFKMAVQQDDSVYVYKDTREAFGTLLAPVRQPMPNGMM